MPFSYCVSKNCLQNVGLAFRCPGLFTRARKDVESHSSRLKKGVSDFIAFSGM